MRANSGEPTLAWLQDNPTSYEDFPLKRNEPGTIAGVTAGLLRFGDTHGLTGEDEICAAWARGAPGLELAPKVDPYVGSVRGIGPALLAYCRMLCGADTINVDVRVLGQLRAFGANVPPADAFAGFAVAGAVAHELGISLIELDQLLWYLG